MQASIIGYNITSALMFIDRKDAQETLAALKTQPQIRQAILYDNKNRVFARYQQEGATNQLPKLPTTHEDKYMETAVGLSLFYNIKRDDIALGVLNIEAGTEGLNGLLMARIGILGTVGICSILFSYILIIRLQKSIADPIDRFVNSMRAVENTANYSLRVVLPGNDELTVLAEQFNKMLVEIERRDSSLSKHSEELEQEVFRRTKDLKLAKNLLEMELRERTLAESARDESEVRYRTLFESTSDAMFVIARIHGEPIVIEANRAAAEMYEYAPEELEGIQYKVLENPGIVHLFQKLYSDLHSGTNTRCELIHRRKNGFEFPVEVSANILHFSGRKYVLLVCRDITERKNEEQRKKEILERQHQSQKMDALGLMAGGVAHDLNNLLSGIIGYPDIILTKLPEDSSIRPYLSSMKKTGERAAEIVQDLLSFTRRGVIGEDIINLNDLVNDFMNSTTIESLRSRAPEVTIRASCKEKLSNIAGSACHLTKVIMNLVTNAAESIIGSGEVLIATQNVCVQKESAVQADLREGWYVLLQVTDTGEGLDEDKKGKIFEPFYSTKTAGRSGTGLGLAIVWGIVQDYGGYIDVQSERGKGTTFRIYFRSTHSQIQTRNHQIEFEYIRGNGEKILIVDDDEEQRALASHMLNHLNYSPVAVTSGAEAIQYVMNHKVDLIMLDMIMDTAMDGLDTYRHIAVARPHLRVVLVSGYSDSVRVKEAQRLGAGMHLKKPYVIRSLGKAIRKELLKKTLIKNNDIHFDGKMISAG